MSVLIGIDLGTTKSVVSAMINGKPIIIPDEQGRLSIPSEILIQGEGDNQSVYAGWESRTKNKYLNDSFVVYAIKRMMGKTNYDNEKWWYVYPQYTISFILSQLKLIAEDYLKEEVKDAIIAIPSHFDLNQRRATLEAAKIAGLNVICLLNEATASALTYFSKHPLDQTIMVVDIGGGTTDISVISSGENVYEVQTISGSTEIGGVDFTNLIYDWFLDKLEKEYNIIPAHINKAVEVLLLDRIELTKKELSDCNESKIYLPYLKINEQFLDKEFVLSQNEFKEMANELVNKILELIKNVKKDFTVDTFLLLGGACKTAGIKERIINELYITPFLGVDPETSVAYGTLIKGESLNRKSKILVLDCLQDDYGIGIANNQYEKILHKGQQIPCKKTDVFITSEDNQTSLNIKVYKGQKPLATENQFLGSIDISDLPPYPKGVVQIDVSFEANSNMDIAVTAALRGNPEHQVKTILRSENGIPDVALDIFCKKASVWRSRKKIQ